MARNSVRGTPVHRIGPQESNRRGIQPGVPHGMDGTVHHQYEGDQTQNRASGGHGTPYTSRAGNPADARREVSRDLRGRIIDNDGLVNNDPASTGRGVLLDGSTYENGYAPPGAATMDSPVPTRAPTFDPADIDVENRAHLGRGVDRKIASGDLVGIGGVMSRGLVGTSSDRGPETELLEDDEPMSGRATQTQPTAPNRQVIGKK